MFQALLLNLRRHNWPIIIGEVSLLAIGLLAAFQVDRWWEQRAEREEERVYIQRLINNIQADIPEIENLKHMQELRLKYANLLLAVAQEPEIAAGRPGEFLAAVVGASYTNFPTLRSHTFDTLRSTGSMPLIRNQEVTAALYEYYDSDRHQTNFKSLFLSTEFRHWELAAGILNPTQALWLQENRVFAQPSNVALLQQADPDPIETRAAAGRLAANQEFINWLPQVREMQTYLVTSLERQVDRAERVLDILLAYAEEIGHPKQDNIE